MPQNLLFSPTILSINSEKVTGEEGVRRLKEMEARGEIRLPTGSRRAMGYIADNPDRQLNHAIILPFLAQNSDGVICLAVFDWGWDDDVRSRDLNLCEASSECDPDCGWLVLRRKQKKP